MERKEPEPEPATASGSGKMIRKKAAKKLRKSKKLKEAKEEKPADSNNAFDASLARLRSQVATLCDCILRAAISYVDARLCIQTTTRMKDIFDNNRPRWREQPQVKQLLESISKLEEMEQQLQETKEFIKTQKNLLIRAYEQMCAIHALQQCKDGVMFTQEQKDKVWELMSEMNVKVVHAMTAMELVLAADNRSMTQIDAAVARHINGEADDPPSLI